VVETLGKVVIDTNVLVSAVLFGGEPGRVVELARAGSVAGVTSLYILEEFLQALTGPKFGVARDIAEALAVEIAGFTEVLGVDRATRAWVDDTSDDPIIETALRAGATHLVTGDQALLRADVPGLRVVTVASLLELAVD